jgi:plasmid stabilization system protein ParE
MNVAWASKAVDDLARLHDFLASVDRAAAARVIRSLVAVPDRLMQHPRLGEKLEQFEPREVRRLLVGRYEVRYEVEGDTVVILRVWHTREER